MEVGMEEENVLREYEHYTSQMEALKVSLELVESSLIELKNIDAALKEISQRKEKSEVLLPIGAGSFVKGRIEDTKNVILSIGAGIAVKKNLKDAMKYIEEKISGMEEVKKERSKTFEETVNKLNELSPAVEKIVAKLQREEESRESK